MSGDTKKSCPELTSEAAIQWAKENNLKVILPNDNQLLIDIDNNYDRGIFEQNRDIIEGLYGIAEVVENKSRSGRTGKWHLIVTLKKSVTPLERLFIQAILGSDRRREAHSLRRITEGEKFPTLFFEKP